MSRKTVRAKDIFADIVPGAYEIGACGSRGSANVSLPHDSAGVIILWSYQWAKLFENMTLTDLIPELQALPRNDKLRVIQMMAAEVAREGDAAISVATGECAVWSPYDAYDGAAALMRALELETASR